MGFTGYSMIGLAIVAAGSIGWATLQGARLDAAKATVTIRETERDAWKLTFDSALKTNANQAAELAKWKKEVQRQGYITAGYLAESLDRQAKLEAELEGINNAPATDDGPIAPVLDRVLDRLRAEYGRPAEGADGSGDRAAAAHP